MPESCVCCYKILWKLCGGACPQCSHGSPAYELMKTGPYLTLFFFHLGRAKLLAGVKSMTALHLFTVWESGGMLPLVIPRYPLHVCTCTFHSEAYIAKYTHALNFPTCQEYRLFHVLSRWHIYIAVHLFVYY